MTLEKAKTVSDNILNSAIHNIKNEALANLIKENKRDIINAMFQKVYDAFEYYYDM